jgi:hypothetical protein
MGLMLHWLALLGKHMHALYRFDRSTNWMTLLPPCWCCLMQTRRRHHLATGHVRSATLLARLIVGRLPVSQRKDMTGRHQGTPSLAMKSGSGEQALGRSRAGLGHGAQALDVQALGVTPDSQAPSALLPLCRLQSYGLCQVPDVGPCFLLRRATVKQTTCLTAAPLEAPKSVCCNLSLGGWASHLLPSSHGCTM